MNIKRVLVTYASLSGSTVDVARTVAEEIGAEGFEVQLQPIQDVQTLEAYDMVVIGAPMILGWHRDAIAFVKANERALSRMPVAYFFTAMSLTQTFSKKVATIPVVIDPLVAQPPRNRDRMSRKEKYSLPANYLQKPLLAAPQVKPVSAAFFGGKMDYSRLGFIQKLFARFIIQAPQGDRRNWALIRMWASTLASTHQQENLRVIRAAAAV